MLATSISYTPPSSSSPAPFQHVHLFYKAHDCPFHENQEPWRGRAPVFKSCLASGRQAPPGRLPLLSAVVERAIWTMERSVFPIRRWFPMPFTPPTPVLQPGFYRCLWDGCRLAACRYTPHRLEKSNGATKGVIEWLLYWYMQTSRSCSCQVIHKHGHMGGGTVMDRPSCITKSNKKPR